MIVKTINYTDFNDVECTEDFWFHLTKTEVVELNVSEGNSDTGLEGYINKIIAEKDNKQIFRLFKKIVAASYGIKSEDGKAFMKLNEHGVPHANYFMQTAAFDELIVSLFDASYASEFIAGLVPQKLGEELDKVMKTDGTVEDDRPAWVVEDREPTKQELQSMSSEQLRAAFAKKSGL